jgi:nitrate reductase NapE component
MQATGPDTRVAVERAPANESKPSLVQVLLAIAFFAVVATATIGWVAFLVWLALPLLGF